MQSARKGKIMARKSEQVKISDDRLITVKTLPLGGYADLFSGLNTVAKEAFNEWDGIETEELLSKLPEIIAKFLPEVANIISIGTAGHVTKQELMSDLGLADAIDLLTSILIVNDIERIIASAKKIKAVIPAKPAEQNQPAQPQHPVPIVPNIPSSQA